MPISADCPQCGKTYNVKDDFAGKKFRCKACEGVVTVPAAGGGGGGEKDPWDNLDLGSFQDQAHAEDDEFAAPAEAPRRRTKGKKKSKSRSGGMPVTVIIALSGIGLLIAFNIFGVVSQLVQGAVPGACGSVFRILIEVGVIVGIVQRSAPFRWIAIVLSGLMVLFLGIGIVGMAFLSQMELPQGAQIPDFMIPVLIVVLAVQIVIEFVIIGTLFAPSSAEYFNT